jgi:hypothetical protein
MYCGSQFQRVQCVVTWLCVSGLAARQSILEWESVAEVDQLMAAREQGKGTQEGLRARPASTD